MDIKLSLQIIRIFKLNADTVFKPTVLIFNIAQFTTAQILGVHCIMFYTII